MIIKEKSISKVTFLTIYISSNTEQIERWKINEVATEYGNFDEQKNSMLFKILDERDEALHKSDINKNKLSSEVKLSYKDSESKISEKRASVNHTSSSSKHKYQVELKYLQKGLVSLNHMKYLIFFSVIIT